MLYFFSFDSGSLGFTHICVTVFHKLPKRLIYPAVVGSITERTSTHELMFTIKDKQSFRASFEKVDAFRALSTRRSSRQEKRFKMIAVRSLSIQI